MVSYCLSESACLAACRPHHLKAASDKAHIGLKGENNLCRFAVCCEDLPRSANDRLILFIAYLKMLKP
jgi:hypothetical protein